MAKAVASVSPTDFRRVPIGVALACIEDNYQATLTKPISPREYELVLDRAIGGIGEICDPYDSAGEMVTALAMAALIEIITAAKTTNDIDELRALIDSIVAAPANDMVKLRSFAAAS